MKVDFLNSDRCKVDDEELIYFMHPNTLRDKLIETVEKVGAQKFFSSPEESVKKARENVAEYFFILGLKKISGLDWFLRQPHNDPPDFELMTVTSNPITITLDPFELVEIPGRCKTFEEMHGIVKGKFNKGYAQNYHLLIFVNHEKSGEWIKELHQKQENFSPFKTVWTVHLVWYKGQQGLYGSVVNRLRPYPAKTMQVALNDEALRQNSPLPDHLEELKVDGKTFIGFKRDFVKGLTTAMRKTLLARLRAAREGQ